jgi:glucosyl-3-phosphoglycerate synthase
MVGILTLLRSGGIRFVFQRQTIEPMVTVIIPALNEEKTIGNVVKTCLAHEAVNEVIVIDDQSEDATVPNAIAAGSNVIVSKKRGKGYSMKEGVEAAKNEIIVFLDADIDPYPEGTIEKLIQPIINDEADFVKGSFARNAGRVTLLVAKPLLSIFYPGLSRYEQPLSGMIAGKKKFFSRIEFFNDYGVDVGILIDMYLMKARIKEINIGYIENKSKPWVALGKMSKEVSRAIITRAQRHVPDIAEEEIERVSFIQQEMTKTITEKLSGYNKMIVFDMDNTILDGRFIDECARNYGFEDQLACLREKEKDPIILTKRIALLLKGRSIDELLEVVHSIPMIPDIHEVIDTYKKNDFLIGIISNSYQLITNYVKQQLNADFTKSHKLEYFNGIANGEVNMPSYFFAPADPVCSHGYCKTHAMHAASIKYNVSLHNCIAVGDSLDDKCMIQHAGKGFAFRTTEPLLKEVATACIEEKSFSRLLDYCS